jgi:hypothetical protein
MDIWCERGRLILQEYSSDQLRTTNRRHVYFSFGVFGIAHWSIVTCVQMRMNLSSQGHNGIIEKLYECSTQP